MKKIDSDKHCNDTVKGESWTKWQVKAEQALSKAVPSAYSTKKGHISKP